MKTLKKISLGEFQIHQLVAGIINNASNPSIQFSMKHDGQKTPIVVVKRENGYSVIDGVHRYKAAVELGNIETLECEVLDIQDDQILDTRITYNQKSKIHTLEVCKNIEHLLGLIGSEQGKRNDLLGNKNLEDDTEFGTAGKDRFERACLLSGLNFSSRTLRKLMAVYDLEKEDNKLGLIDGINDGKLSIDKAHTLMKDYFKKSNQNDSECYQLPAVLENKFNNVSYRIFNESSMNMGAIENESIDMFCDSHPYLKLRKYRNQIGLKHGEEKTLEEYVSNFVLFCNEKWKKLKPGGVLVTILGETYKGGYNGVCTAVETALKNEGWEIVDVVIWVKQNQKYAPHPLRFVNSYERIIVLRKPGAKTFFKEVKRESSIGEYKVMPTSGGGFYLATPETCIPNVIVTNVHNPAEFNEVDKEFRHQAPAPEQIYTIFIDAYSKPGDTICDGFAGSGTIGVGLSMGRNVIAYEVDKKSYKFCIDRFENYMSKNNIELQIAA
jgi:DNA modification methylase